MAVIELHNISKYYGKITAVEDFSLKVNGGEFIVLVGPSGCGKTTILRLLAGLTELSSGKIIVDGTEISQLPAGQRNMAMVFQNYALFPHMTVEGNLSFGMRLRRVPKRIRDKKVREIAQILRIDDLLNRYPRELSGGQKQRVALGRALMREPTAFLLDEPLSNLDPALRVAMRAEICEIHNRFPITTVYVTHDQVEAMTMGNRIAVMDKGKLMQVGEPKELYWKPENLFTACFIGSPAMNTLPANVDVANDELILRGNGYEWRLNIKDRQLPPSLPKRVVIGIRPEHLRIVSEYEDKILGGRVVLVEELGREEVVHLKHNEVTLRVISTGGRKPNIDEIVFVSAERGTVHLFEEQTGRRLLTETL